MVAESKFADPVHAVVLLPGCSATLQQAGRAEAHPQDFRRPPQLASQAIIGASQGVAGATQGVTGAPPGVPVAAVGLRLVAFELKSGRMWKRHLAATAQPITCLSPGSSPGKLHKDSFANCMEPSVAGKRVWLQLHSLPYAFHFAEAKVSHYDSQCVMA